MTEEKTFIIDIITVFLAIIFGIISYYYDESISLGFIIYFLTIITIKLMSNG